LIAEGENLTKDQQESLRIIETSGYHLLAMIENILQLGKVDAGKRDEVIETEFDLKLLFNELQGMLSMHDSSGNVPIHWNIPDDVPKPLTGDAGKIRQILLNIVGNSIKYTQSGLICVDCEWKPSVDQKNENQHPRATILRLTITDTGSGISESDMEHLFTPFFQAGENAQTQKGAGLGLSICKHYVDLLGGEINIQSKLGLGTKIRLTLPVLSSFDTGQLSLEETSEAEPSIEFTFSPAQARILIVEDDPVNAKLISAMLEPHGYNLKIVTNGLLGVKTAQQWRPHLIWMDIRMPVMDGKEAASRIRSLSLAESWAVRPVIIALTADAQQTAGGLAKSSVFDHLMIKPTSKEDLIAAINSFLSEKSQSSGGNDKS
jgi:CheY-like chemotaxis protein